MNITEGINKKKIQRGFLSHHEIIYKVKLIPLTILSGERAEKFQLGRCNSLRGGNYSAEGDADLTKSL